MDSSEIWNLISQVVESEGLELFDLDKPVGFEAGTGSVLRVFVIGKNKAGVSFDDCSRVSKRLLDLDEENEFIPESCMLEVSSPGVNRRLRRPEHFGGAVGERVKLRYALEQGGARTVIGQLCGFNGDSVELEVEPAKKKGVSPERLTIALNNIKEAKIDFLFT